MTGPALPSVIHSAMAPATAGAAGLVPSAKKNAWSDPAPLAILLVGLGLVAATVVWLGCGRRNGTPH